MAIDHKLVTKMARLLRDYTEGNSHNRPGLAAKIAEEMPKMDAESRKFLEKAEADNIAVAERIMHHPLFNLMPNLLHDPLNDPEAADRLMSELAAQGNAAQPSQNKLKHSYTAHPKVADMSEADKIRQQAFELAELDKEYEAFKKAYYPGKEDDVEKPITEPEGEIAGEEFAEEMEDELIEEAEAAAAMAEEQEQEFTEEREGVANKYIDDEGNFIGDMNDLIDCRASQAASNAQEELYRQLEQGQLPQATQNSSRRVSTVKPFDEQFTVWQDLASKWNNLKKKCVEEIAALVGHDRGKALLNKQIQKSLEKPTSILKLVCECITVCMKWLNDFRDRKSLTVSESNTTQSPEIHLAKLHEQLRKAEIKRSEKQDPQGKILKAHDKYIQTLKEKINYVEKKLLQSLKSNGSHL